MGKEKRKVHLSTPERLAAGATAGAVGKSAVAPFQRVQIMYQVNPGQKLSFGGAVSTTKDILKNEGVSALWRGNWANAARSAPTAAIKFWTQALYSQKIRQRNWSRGTSQFVGGSLSGVTTVVATYPMDLFRTKLAANKDYKGYWDCTVKTVQRSGIKGLFHGMSAPVVGSIPHTGIAFWTFDYMKQLMGVDENSTAAAPLRRTTAGFLAGFAGQTVTYPFSTIRRRMQTSVEWQQKGLIKCAVDTVQHEGFLGLFRAYSIHAFKGPISAAISFACNDIIKQKMKEFKMQREEQKEALTLEQEETDNKEVLLTQIPKEEQRQT